MSTEQYTATHAQGVYTAGKLLAKNLGPYITQPHTVEIHVTVRLSQLVRDLAETGHHITARALQNQIRAGKIKGVRKGNLWMIPVAEYERIMSERGGRPSRVHPERPRKTREWSAENHMRTIERRYNITAAGYEAMCAANDYCCTICGEDPRVRFAHLTIKSQRLNVDHDHTTGAIRGLLCQLCNKRVAFAGDTPERIRRLLEYVEGRITPPAQLDLFKASA